jgi:hypothetical protein
VDDFQAAAITRRKQRQDRGITVPNNAVVGAIGYHPLQVVFVAAVVRFTEITERLIKFAAAIFMHDPAIAGTGIDVPDHVTERLCSVTSGAHAKNLKARYLLLVIA